MSLSETSEAIPADVLDRVEEALTNIATAVLAVAPSLEKPYPDDPRWTPWTRFVERPGNEAINAREALRRARGK